MTQPDRFMTVAAELNPEQEATTEEDVMSERR